MCGPLNGLGHRDIKFSWVKTPSRIDQVSRAISKGANVGCAVGDDVGSNVGTDVGCSVGPIVGAGTGSWVGAGTGSWVGAGTGSWVGAGTGKRWSVPVRGLGRCWYGYGWHWYG